MQALLILAASVTLAWDPSPNAESYRLYVGIQSLKAGNPPITFYPTAGNVTQYTIGGLNFGNTYYFAATALGNGLESPYSNEVVYVAVPPGPETIWPDTVMPFKVDSGADARCELGLRFVSDVPVVIVGARFYKSAANTGRHVANLWNSVGVRLASATFVNETPSGWQQVLFAVPVVVTAGQTYTISYRCENGHYSTDTGYFPNGNATNGVMHGVNSAYAYGSSTQFPTQNWQNTNYWVDVMFTE